MSRELVIVVLSLMAVGAGLMAFTHVVRQIGSGQRRRDWVKYGVFFCFVGVMLLVFVSGALVTALVFGAIALVGVRELFDNVNGKQRTAILATVGSLLLLLGVGHLVAFQIDGGMSRLLFLFLVVAVTDSFSQLWGRLLGRRKLCPRLSPGKTIEGLLLGIASALVCSALLSFLLTLNAVGLVFLLGLITAGAAIVGDLAFSFIKRKMAIKDFANTLPGHGGVLDRLDSLIVAAPVFYWVHRLILR